MLLGDAAVGKTTLFRRWIGTALDVEYAPSTTGEQAANERPLDIGQENCADSLHLALHCSCRRRQAASPRGARAGGCGGGAHCHSVAPVVLRVNCRLNWFVFVAQLWDVPPQSFAGSSIFARYLRSTQAIVLVFSLQEPVSWCTLPMYLDVARREISASASVETGSPKAPTPVVMVGNKSDCIDAAGLEEQQAARAWCSEHGITYVEVSALAGDTAALLGVLKTVSLN